MQVSSRQSVSGSRRVNSLALYLMSLAAMIGLYSLYAKFLVPVIEGPPNLTQYEFRAPNVELSSQQFDREKLASLFPQDAWEHGDCKVLVTHQGLVLFKEFQRVEGGYLEVLPFTLVMNSTNHSGNAPMVLRCSKGAKLKFDRPDLDPLAGKNSLESAWLVGAVDIYRPAGNSTQDDSIEILTSNVQFDKRQIFTIDEVQFAFGNHQGSGRQLSMEFAHQQDALGKAGFETIVGFKRIELAYLKRLSLSPKTEKLAVPSGGLRQPAPNPQSAGATGQDLVAATDTATDLVEITCSGPFVLDLERKTATFNDQVSVSMEGETRNEILCKRLTVHFDSDDKQSKLLPAESNPADQLAGDSWNLQRLVAEGSPATFLSQTHATKVTGDVLSYHVTLQEIGAQPRPQSNSLVNIVTPDLRFEAVQVAYKLKPEGGLGELIAMGPGNLLRPGNEQERELMVRWERVLSIEPDQAQQLITLVDGCQVRFDRTTEIESQKMQIWLNEWRAESPSEPNASKPSPQYQPDRLLANGNVKMVSPQLSGTTKHLVATWIPFDNGENQHTKRIEPTATGSANPATANRQRQLRVSYSGFPLSTGFGTEFWMEKHKPVQDDQTNSTRMQPIVRIPAESISQLDPVTTVRPVDFQESAPPLKRYSFSGNEIDVKLHSTGKESAVQDLTATGDVTLSELADPLAKSKRPPLTIKGNHLRYVPQADETARVLVTGQAQQPAVVTAEQFRLQGNQINLDQSANKIWVEGGGEVEFDPKSLSTRSSLQADQTAGNDGASVVGPTAYQSVKLSWASGMVFNGRKIYFEDSVNLLAQGVNQTGNGVQTSAFGQGVSLELNQHIDFRNTNSESSQAIEIREVVIVNQVAGSQRVFNLASANLSQARDASSTMALISHKTVDPNGQELERQTFQAKQVTFEVATGMMTSKGPGVLTRHGRGNTPLLKGKDSGLGQPAAAAPMKLTESDHGISLIRVNFDGIANANVNEKRLLIQGNVRTLYAGVASFDQTLDPDQMANLPESAVKVKCDRLDFTQWTPRDSDKPLQELLAEGNAHVTSGSFEARANQIRYIQATDTLGIEGTARSDAQLWYYPNASARERQHLVAQKILYRPGDRSYELESIKHVEMNR